MNPADHPVPPRLDTVVVQVRQTAVVLAEYHLGVSESEDTGLPRIGRPATAALGAVGIVTIAEAAAYGRTRLLQLHGVGPKAIRLLDEALAAHGISWADE